MVHDVLVFFAVLWSVQLMEYDLTVLRVISRCDSLLWETGTLQDLDFDNRRFEADDDDGRVLQQR